MVCSVSLSIACLGKLGPQKHWVSEGTMETLLLFIGEFSGQPASPNVRGGCFYNFSVEAFSRRIVPSWFSSMWLFLSLLLHSLMCQHSKLTGVRTSTSHSVSVATKAYPSVSYLNLMLIPTGCTAGKPGPSNTNKCGYVCIMLSKRD